MTKHKHPTKSKEEKVYEQAVVDALNTTLKLAKSGKFFALAMFVADDEGVKVILPGHQNPEIDAHLQEQADEMRAAMVGAVMGVKMTSKTLEAVSKLEDALSDNGPLAAHMRPPRAH
jgi:adenosylmethionine-8-amino-7-oxononanoate aminotransferase